MHNITALNRTTLGGKESLQNGIKPDIHWKFASKDARLEGVGL